MKFYISLILLSFWVMPDFSQAKNMIDLYYNSAYQNITDMLSGKKNLNFQKAVFLTENAYHGDSLNINAFDDLINFYSVVAKSIMESGNIEYTEKDTDVAMAQCVYNIIEK